MRGVPASNGEVALRFWRAAAVLLLTAWSTGAAMAQTNLSSTLTGVPTPAPAADAPAPAAVPDSGILQTGCPGCSGGDLPPPSYNHGEDGGCGCGCGPCKGCGCIPGQPKCYCECCGEATNCFSRFVYGVYNCICCPDPCYEPHWNAVQDCAFFQDAARPVTQMKLTWDTAWDFQDPDRAEFFWARERTNPNQIGPGNPGAPMGTGKGPQGIARSLNYDELTYYTEAAVGGAGVSIAMPYLHISPEAGAANAGLMPSMMTPTTVGATTTTTPASVVPVSGFGDMVVGTKAMLLDCDCIQITFGFKTYIPVGDFTKGLGTGHVSLEPSLIFGIPLCKGCFLQMQQAYWIPIGGDPLYEANVYHGHYAINHELWCPCPGLRLVGTLELNHWVVFTGAFTDPEFLLAAQGVNNGSPSPIAQPAGASIISTGPGIRFVICDKIDFGVGSAIAITGQHWADQTVRAEFRWRF